MAKDKLETLRLDWRDAEDKYAHAVADLLDDKPDERPDKKIAVKVTQLRSKADTKMAAYLKRALRD